MDLATVIREALGGAVTLSRDIGKGGGGSTDEPTVCMTLLPFAAGLVLVLASEARRRARRSRPAGAAG